PVAGRQERLRAVPPGRDQPGDRAGAALSRVRADRHRGGDARRRAAPGGADALVRCRAVPPARRGAAGPARHGGARPAAHAAGRAAGEAAGPTFDPPARRKPGSVGLPLPGYTITIRDSSGEPAEQGDVGEICVSGEALMLGYWGEHDPDPEGTALVDGELRTGDLGCLDDDGYLYVVDRKKDLIIRGGFNVFPRDVEDVLDQHPDVVMSGVVGRLDDRLGEEVVAFV